MSRPEAKDAARASSTAAERLAQQRKALQQAEHALADAEIRMDVPTAVRLQGEIAVIRRFVSKLQVEAAGEVEGQAREEAATVIAALHRAYGEHLSVLDAAAEDARKAIRHATLVARTCYGHWNDAARARHEIGLLELRFGLRGSSPLAPLPEAPNVAVAVFDEEVAGTTLLRFRPIPVPRRVSDTPDERRATELEAVGKYIKKHLGELSPDVRALFEKAQVPNLTPPETAEPREGREARDRHAQAEARRMAQEIAAERLQAAPPSGGPIKSPLSGMRG